MMDSSKRAYVNRCVTLLRRHPTTTTNDLMRFSDKGINKDDMVEVVKLAMSTHKFDIGSDRAPW